LFFIRFAQKGVIILCTLNKILELLEKNNVKQKDLTDYLGISKNAFTNWKGGFSKSYIKHLPQIAEFFNVSVDYLLGRDSVKQDEVDFTYAAYDELTHDLTPEQVAQLKTYADFLRRQK
jgi:transcriptional regulator with XRE-family HTH domain